MLLSSILSDARINRERVISMVPRRLWTCCGQVYCGTLFMVFLLALLYLISEGTEVVSDLL